MRRLVCLLAFGSVLFATASTASAVEAATITAVGWWSQRPGASELPEGGFELALAPNGPISEAALRVDVAPVRLTSALLELTESGQVLAEVAGVQACPTSEGWTPANPGAWSDAPAANCSKSAVALGRSADGVWTADVESLLRPGSVSIVLVPVAEVSEQQQSVAFQLVFEKAKLTASSKGSSPGADSGGQPATASDPTVIAAPDLSPVMRGPASVPAATPAAPSADVTTDAPAEEDSAAAETGGDPKPWWRLLIGVPASGLAGLGAVVARRALLDRGFIGG